MPPEASGAVCARPGLDVAQIRFWINRLGYHVFGVRAYAGGFSIQLCAIATAEFPADVIQSQSSLASPASLKLLPDVAPDLAEVLADCDHLLQVFENAIGNAI